MLVSGCTKAPTPPIFPVTNSTAGSTSFAAAQDEFEAKLEAWEMKADKAAGSLYLMLEEDQKIHISSIRSDAFAMWNTLDALYMKKKPRARFHS